MEGDFFVVCGRTDRPVSDGLCAECFAGRHPLVGVVDHPTVTLCPVCGSRKDGERWIPSGTGKMLGKEDLVKFLRPLDEVGIRKVLFTEVGREANTRRYDGVVTARFRGEERELPVELAVRVNAQTCPSCSRKAGHFFVAQLQLRGPEGRLPSGARQRRERLRAAWESVFPEAKADWKNALSWAEERPEGWDFFLTDTTAARNLAKLLKDRLGGTTKESATLYGRKDGQDVYRVTICLRIPNLPEARLPERTGPSDDPVDADPVE